MYVSHQFLLSAPSQSNTRQSLATKSVVNKLVKSCIETLRQRNIKKAIQYCPQTVDIGSLWRIRSLGDHSEQCSFIKFVNSTCSGCSPYGSKLLPISSTCMAIQCSPGRSLSWVLHTKADGYVATTSGRVL